MKEKRKLTVLVDSGFNNDYKKFLESRFNLEVVPIADYEKGKLTSSIDLLLFTGGADVNPEMYNEKVGTHTSINNNRDNQEKDIFYRFDYLPKLGICRGSQFLTVMSGGKLVQHISGHLGNHKIHVKKNNRGLSLSSGKFLTYDITSTHHQMMFPFNLNKKFYNILGWSKRFRSETYLNGSNEEIELPTHFVEPEIVFYNNSNSLCVQGHPEFSTCPKETSIMILDLVENLLLSKESEKLVKHYEQW